MTSYETSRLFGVSVLTFATLFFSSQLALAQFSQQGPKLVGTFAVGDPEQGFSVALSADGNTAIVGGPWDNSQAGAAWVYTLSGGVWTQQGSKLVPTDPVGPSQYGGSVALSADGNTAIVGGALDNSGTGAAWVFTRSGGLWAQQGSKLVGIGTIGGDYQGISVALSADGNTAIVGAPRDTFGTGAALVYTRSSGAWTQQTKLVGTGAVGYAGQGASVASSADGNTAIVGGPDDNSATYGAVGAAWIFTRSGGVWTQQGGKLVGTGVVGVSGGGAFQGTSVALSADGNTAIVGGPFDNPNVGSALPGLAAGAAWVYTRSDDVWSQQGSKLVGTGAAGPAKQGTSVALSADGNTAVVGGPYDNLAGPLSVGAAWAFVRNGGVWTEQGNKLVGTGATGNAAQGTSVAISGDGYTALLGGPWDNTAAGTFLGYGAAWVFTQPALQVKPNSNITASGTHGGPFSPSSFKYTLSASKDSVSYAITAPSWLTVSSKSGTLSTSPKPITFTINSSAHSLAPNTYVGSVSLHNTISGAGDTNLVATLIINPKDYKLAVGASPAADGSVTGGGEVPEGSSTTVTATAHSGFQFVQWTENGRQVSTSSSYTFAMPSNAVTVIAHFQKN